jgi:hypothetical protein
MTNVQPEVGLEKLVDSSTMSNGGTDLWCQSIFSSFYSFSLGVV